MAIVLITACLAHAPKECMQSGNFHFDISYPFQNTAQKLKRRNVCKGILKTLFQRYKLELTTGIQARIDLAFINIREFKIP